MVLFWKVYHNEFVMNEVKVDSYTVLVHVCQEVCMVYCVKVSLTGTRNYCRDWRKFGKMEYGRGRPVTGQWVFGGIERGTDKSFFWVVERRAKVELLSVIKEWILPEMSDCWRAYNCLSDTFTCQSQFDIQGSWHGCAYQHQSQIGQQSSASFAATPIIWTRSLIPT